MDKKQVIDMVAGYTLKQLFSEYPYTVEFFSGIRIESMDEDRTLQEGLDGIAAEYLDDFGLTREEIYENFIDFIAKVEESGKMDAYPVQELTIIGGYDKSGTAENTCFSAKPGEIIGIVGPTGSGKSRLLGDIECLAQEDTPTRRKVLINGRIPSEEQRFAVENRLIAQLSQNMNFVMDLTVMEFLTMHAQSRMVEHQDEVVQRIFECANSLAGEQFTPEMTVTQLSGGQSRALMIADTALLSHSPIVLIDEIENAGIDRRRAIELLTKREKIVFLSTHDPMLALMANRRIVIKNGGISKIIETSERERENLLEIERRDNQLNSLRNRIRKGESIDFDVAAYFQLKHEQIWK